MAERQKPGDSGGTTLQVRLDKWLQVARIYKTRSQASEAIDAGHVRMDGARAKAGRTLRIGDRIEVVKGSRRLQLQVLGLAEKPMPAAEARKLVEIREEHETLDGLSPEQREVARLMRQMDRAAQASRRGQGRPTKRERRDLDKGRP
jgi:ribosome-associated heat shock protein Hsp15